LGGGVALELGFFENMNNRRKEEGTVGARGENKRLGVDNFW